MTTIGTAVLQIIPSLDNVSKSIDNQLGGTLRASGKSGGKQFAKGVGEGLKDLEREVESAGRAYQKLKDKATDSLGKVRTEEAKLVTLRNAGKQDTAQYIAIEERRNKALRDSGRATREAVDGHSALLTAQKRLGDGTDNLGRKFGGLSDLAGTASKAMTAGVAVAAGATVIAIAGLAVGVVAASKALYDLGAQFDDVFDNIRIKTGATGPALQQLEQATERLATKVPLSIAEIGNVVAETSRALHLTGTDLDNTSRAIAELGRLTGENIDVRTLGKAFRGFGVDAKSQVPALDSLLRASQTTGVGVNELLATVVKGGAGLRQFGFDFGESAALATQFEGAGLDADKAMTGLTKGLAGLAKDGKTGQDALRGTVGQIKDLLKVGNDAGALELTNKLFGAKGGVQFFEAIKNGALDLDALSASMANTGDTIAQAAADTDDWAERWQIFKNEISVGLQPIGTAVFDGINGKLTELADWVSTHKAEVIQFFGDLASTVTQKTAEALHGISLFISQGLVPILRSVEDFGKNNFLANLIPGAEELGGAAGMLADGLDKIPGPLDRAADSVAGFVPTIDALTARTVDAQRFTTALGDATGAVSAIDGRTIEISTNTPEVVSGLDALGIKITTLPNGKFGVIPGTPEAARILQNFRDQQNKIPITPLVTPKIKFEAVDVSIGNYFANLHPVITPLIGGGGSFAGPPSLGDRFNPAPRAAGGPIFGAGTGTSDSIPAYLSNGEHVWTAREVERAGGHGAMYRMRAAVLRGYAGGGGIKTAQIPWPPGPIGPTGSGNGNVPDPSPGNYPGRIAYPDWSIPGQGWGTPPADWWTKPVDPEDILFPDWMPPGQRDNWLDQQRRKRWKPLGFSGGGAVGPDVMAAGELVGTAYSQANRTDCSGMVARVIDRTMGMPESGLMSTKNAEEWLAARGFKPGVGGPGQISVGWYDHGPNPNDGHMAMTLSDGSSAEAGGGVGDIFQIGGGAAGASDPQFDRHMFLPTVYGEGKAGSGSASPFAGGSAVAAMTGGSTPAASGSSGGGSSGGSASISLPSSFSGLAGIGLDGLGVKTKASPDSPERTFDIGGVASAAVGGQIDSALGVFGIPGSPGWLKGISQLVGGISIGGGSAAPLSATPTGTGTPPPDDPGNMHGSRAGQAPGPTYNITAGTTEDALLRTQRLEKEKSALKLQRF